MSPQRIERQGLRLDGDLSWLVPFAPEHRDDPAYLGWMRDPKVVRTLNLPEYLSEPVTYEKIAAYGDAMMTSERDLFLALHDRSDDAFIGTLKAGHIDWHAGIADLGIMIGRRDRWGRGIAADSLFVLAQYLFDSVGMRKLTAGAMAINPAIIAVFEKLGFQHEARLRRQDRLEDSYCDHLLLGCFRNELRKPKYGLVR